ncbi:MAG: hypothetical protein J2P25_07135 [Nocardiopsaceae bacterium]|nr:hypothetical protein [Nocardiopsaceae bacterium]
MPAASGPLTSKLVIAGCSRRKADTQRPVPALELYQGGSIPWLRARTGGDPRLRARINVLSAAHGLVPADRPLLPYDRQMDPERAAELTAGVTAVLARDWASTGRPQEILVIAEPLYLVPLAAILATPARVHWIADLRDTAAAGSVLDQWGWP